MSNDNFDYLDQSLSDWLTATGEPVSATESSLIRLIELEYLPNFEAAIWRRAAAFNA